MLCVGRMGKKKEAGGLRSFVAGGVGGVCTVVSGQPFDTLKVNSILSSVPHIWIM